MDSSDYKWQALTPLRLMSHHSRKTHHKLKCAFLCTVMLYTRVRHSLLDFVITNVFIYLILFLNRYYETILHRCSCSNSSSSSSNSSSILHIPSFSLLPSITRVIVRDSSNIHNRNINGITTTPPS